MPELDQQQGSLIDQIAGFNWDGIVIRGVNGSEGCLRLYLADEIPCPMLLVTQQGLADARQETAEEDNLQCQAQGRPCSHFRVPQEAVLLLRIGQVYSPRAYVSIIGGNYVAYGSMGHMHVIILLIPLPQSPYAIERL